MLTLVRVVVGLLLLAVGKRLFWLFVAAAGVVAFLAGGYLGIGLLGLFGVELGTQWWQPFLLGGILGALISYPLFDWALIVLSALTGAVLIVQALEIGPGWALPLTVLAALVGVTIQAGVLRRGRRPKPVPDPDPD